jgi:hypothetical protein
MHKVPLTFSMGMICLHEICLDRESWKRVAKGGESRFGG